MSDVEKEMRCPFCGGELAGDDDYMECQTEDCLLAGYDMMPVTWQAIHALQARNTGTAETVCRLRNAHRAAVAMLRKIQAVELGENYSGTCMYVGHLEYCLKFRHALYDDLKAKHTGTAETACRLRGAHRATLAMLRRTGAENERLRGAYKSLSGRFDRMKERWLTSQRLNRALRERLTVADADSYARRS